MSKFDLVASNQHLVIDLCEDSEEAEHVRVWRRQHKFTTLSVLGGPSVDAIEVTRDAARKLHPQRVYQNAKRPWLVISLHGEAPAKVALEMD